MMHAGSSILVGLVLVATANPAQADTQLSAEDRLGACLLSGSSSVRHADVASVVTAVRARCGRDIRRVREDRVEAAVQAAPPAQAGAAERVAVRKLDNEITLAIAKYAGFTLDDFRQ
jgi:hypothetical protein